MRPASFYLVMAISLFVFIEGGRAQEEALYLNQAIGAKGEAKILVAPDVAKVRLHILASEKTLDAAVALQEQKRKALVEALKASGVPERDIGLGRVSFLTGPSEGERQKLMVAEEIEVTIADLGNAEVAVKRISRIIDAAVAAGASLGGLKKDGRGSAQSAVVFTVKSPKAYESQLLTSALDDAESKAEEVAHRMGVDIAYLYGVWRLGDVEVKEVPFDYPGHILSKEGAPPTLGKVELSYSIFAAYFFYIE